MYSTPPKQAAVLSVVFIEIPPLSYWDEPGDKVTRSTGVVMAHSLGGNITVTRRARGNTFSVRAREKFTDDLKTAV